MRLGGRAYVTTRGCEDAERAGATQRALADVLAERLERGLLSGYEVTVVATEEDWEMAAIDRDSAEAATGGRLPFVYATVGYDADDARHRTADLGDVLDRFGLELVWELSPADG